MYLFAFSGPMPFTWWCVRPTEPSRGDARESETSPPLRYELSRAEEPHRTRVKGNKNPQPRDVTEWSPNHARTPLETSLTGFWAMPEPTPGSTPFSVDWTSSPDRYCLSRRHLPELSWLRCFRFLAYAAHKFHVYECARPQCYRVERDHYVMVEEGWRLLFAFYAFEDQVPGTMRYYVQEQDGPHFRTRVGMQPDHSESRGWRDKFSFCAFDLALPGTCKLKVHYALQSTEEAIESPEQYRIYTGDHWGMWEHKFEFYAYPAPVVQLDPNS